MRRFLSTIMMLATFLVTTMAQSMSDSQVLDYLQQASKQGKTQQQMTTELMSKGVTQEQVLRIKAQYQSGNLKGSNGASQQIQQGQNRTRTGVGVSGQDGSQMQNQQIPIYNNRVTGRSPYSPKPEKKQKDKDSSDKKKEDKSIPKFMQPGSDRLNRLAETAEDSIAMGLKKEDNFFKMEDLQDDNNVDSYYDEVEPENRVFGHDIFSNGNLTFEPNLNLATPDNYRLGPGDEVIIDIWGASESTIRETISPEGSIQVSSLGPVYLNGLTVKEANKYIKEEFAKIYSGISDANPTTSVKLSLGESRSIRVNVMGEVAVPGTYTLSPFASVFHALYSAGGVSDIGGMRSVKIVRKNKTVADVDIYEYITKGFAGGGERLEDGDVVIVEPFQTLVQITGKVKRPMYYEMKPSETVQSLLAYAGGFTGDAYKKALRLVRRTGREHQIYNVDEMDYGVFRLEDGDVLEADSVLARFENRVEIKGAVYREGMYQLNGQMNTVKQLISKAEGLRGDAFRSRAVLDREREDYTHEIIALDIEGMMNGTAPDVVLSRNDVIYIPSIHNMREERTVAIHGQVANEGVYLFSDKMTVEDLIIQAGGMLEPAAVINVNVARRVKQPSSSTDSNLMGETFSFEISENLVRLDGKQFYLEPFDEVYIRRSPAYREQENVSISGEVLFAGNYAMVKKTERISDLVKRAGGLTSEAYVRGARLLRKMNEDEVQRQKDLLRISKLQQGASSDSLVVEELKVSDLYTVGIDLEKAMDHPGSDYDLVLREGDELVVPQYTNTVKISGAVLYPNTVSFKNGKGSSYYIDQAGGYQQYARKSKAYVLHLNGTVSRLKKHSKSGIEPGCEIIVPTKDRSRRMSLSEVMGMSSAGASMAAVIASIVSLFK